MATDPTFASTPVVGAALLGAAETDLLAPAQSSTILTAGASGTKIEEVVVQAAKTATLIATTVAGQVYLFVHDGSAYHLYDTVLVTAVTASTTVAPFRLARQYLNLWLPTGYSLRASQSIAGNASVLKVHAFGANW